VKTLEHIHDAAADLYWLAFLLTGHSQLSVDLTLEALDFGSAGKSVLSLLARSRRAVIAKALAAMRDELTASACRMRSPHHETAIIPDRTWSLDPSTTKVQLEHALLAIDMFPRCAVLLTVFEGMRPDEAAALLDSEPDLVQEGRMAGLRNMTSILSTMQSRPPTKLRESDTLPLVALERL
jgi:hypothetical protein